MSESEGVPRDPGLQLFHPVEYLDVEEDEQHDGDDDLHDEVHPEDVDPDVDRVGPHAGRFDGVDGLVVAAFLAVVLWTDGRDADLEELWHVVDQGEDGDGDDEGSACIFSPETNTL